MQAIIIKSLQNLIVIRVFWWKWQTQGYVASPSKSPTLLFAQQHNQAAKGQAFTAETTPLSTQKVTGAAVLQLKPWLFLYKKSNCSIAYRSKLMNALVGLYSYWY